MQAGTYAFIYDDLLNDRRYERDLAAIEARLTSLDVQGRIGRLTLFRSAKDLIESMVSQGVGTVVVVGNDRSLDKVLWFLPDLDVTLGYLPVEGPSPVADLLGIPTGVGACDILAARLIETLDMGTIDGRYFLTEASIPSTIASVDIEGRYRISPMHGGSITIRNLGNGSMNGLPQADAKDGLLEVVVLPGETPRKSRWDRSPKANETRILIRHGEIVSPDPVDVQVDHHVLNGFRFRLGIVPRSLRVITGRARRLVAVEGLSNRTRTATLPNTQAVLRPRAVPAGGYRQRLK